MPLLSYPKCPQVPETLWSSLVFKAQYNLYVANMSHLIEIARRVQLFANMHIFEEGKGNVTLYAENILTVLSIRSWS